MKFTNPELQAVAARRAAQFPTKFNSENPKKKCSQRDGKCGGHQTPKKKKASQSSSSGADAASRQVEENPIPKSPPCQASPPPTNQETIQSTNKGSTPSSIQNRPPSPKPTDDPSSSQQGCGGAPRVQTPHAEGEK